MDEPTSMRWLRPPTQDRMQAMLGYTECRTKFFDESFWAVARHTGSLLAEICVA